MQALYALVGGLLAGVVVLAPGLPVAHNTVSGDVPWGREAGGGGGVWRGPYVSKSFLDLSDQGSFSEGVLLEDMAEDVVFGCGSGLSSV